MEFFNERKLVKLKSHKIFYPMKNLDSVINFNFGVTILCLLYAISSVTAIEGNVSNLAILGLFY